MISTKHFPYDKGAVFKREIIARCPSGQYRCKLWGGFINYYDSEDTCCQKRLGYEVIQAGYELIDLEENDNDRP